MCSRHKNRADLKRRPPGIILFVQPELRTTDVDRPALNAFVVEGGSCRSHRNQMTVIVPAITAIALDEATRLNKSRDGIGHHALFQLDEKRPLLRPSAGSLRASLR